jgi:transglutaminase-like putative cysteine protease
LRVELSGVQAQALSLNGGRQSYQAPDLTIVKEQIPPATHRQKIDNPDIIRFLQSGPLVQSDHPRIQELADEITGKADSDIEKIRLLMDWIKDHIQKRPVLSIPNALAILENRMGDCNEHAVLFAALARAIGIPTRIEAGVVYLKHRFYYHAWNAVYLGEWVTLDALFYQFPADVTHIRLAGGDLKDQLDILGLIGNLNIHIQDDTHSDDSAQ